MRSLITAALAALTTAIVTPTLIWNQNEQYAVYTSAGLSRHIGTTPTFATATWLNPPIAVQTYNVSQGTQDVIWEFDSSLPQSQLSTFMTDMARHAISPQNGRVDVVAAQANFVPPSNCDVYGWSSLASNVSVWNYSIPNCDSSLLYDDDRYIDIADDGSTVAFSGFLPTGNSNQPVLTVLSGQTGAVLFTKNLPTGAGGGPVQLSENGTYVAWTNGDSVSVYTTSTGEIRDTVVMGWNSQAQISDSGDFLAFGGQDTGYIYQWDSTNKQYKLAFTLVPPGGGTWYSISTAMASDGSGTEDGELVTYSWTDGSSLTARLTVFSLVTGKLVVDYTTTTNAKLQTSPTVRADGQYAAICFWGDDADVPTVAVFQAGNNTPIFTYITPGSMFAIDVLYDRSASTPTNDVVYLTTAGKHTPANEFGNGGDAYAWRLDISK